MGREVRRVPLDFDWPMGEPWKGYLNPHYKPCPNPDCRAGRTPDGAALEHLVHLILIAGGDSLRGRLHPWLASAGVEGLGWHFHELTTGLAERSPDRPFGHDCIDRWVATRKVIAAAGLDPDKWGKCPTCHGHADDPATHEAAEAWEREDPPTGDGWQLWETISEGSPITPVYPTAEGLIEHMSQPNDRGRHPWDRGWSREVAEQFVRGPGWAPSFVASANGLVDGVTATPKE